MHYYMFNNNEPLKSTKHKHAFIIHYCQHCNTEVIGEWLLKDNENDLSSTLIDQTSQKECLDFAYLTECPVCGKKFANNLAHHFCNYHMYFYDSLNKIIFNELLRITEETIKEIKYVPKEETIKYEDLSDFTGCKLEQNSIINTKNGHGIILYNSSEYKQVGIKYYENNIDSILLYLANSRLNIHKQEAEVKIKAFIDNIISKCNDDTIETFEPDRKVNIREYLEQLLLIEKNIFSISKRLGELYFLNCEAGKEAFASEKLLFLKEKNSVDKALENYKALKSKKIEKKITLEDFPITYPKEPQKPKEPAKPVLATPGFFNKKRVLTENALLTEKYEKELAAYNTNMAKYESDLKKREETIKLLEKQREDEYNSALEKGKEKLEKEIAEAKAKCEDLLKKQEEAAKAAKDIATPEKVKHVLLKEEIATAEELLKKFYKAQSQMYSYGILFEKYRNFVAVSSFFEYISSGRCETLEGADGAYNLYENEIRMNMVIGQLNQVIESLEEIKQNQYMIYSAIQETNSQLSKLNSSMGSVISTLSSISADTSDMKSYMSKIADNTEVIAYNTEKTAYYAKKNAELTNALGFLVALK